MFFIDDGHAADEIFVVLADGAQGIEEVAVDFEDDVEVARQQATHQVDRPAFQGFAHQGVVGVRENLARHTPSFLPSEAFFIEQHAHQFGNRQYRVGVVQVDGHFIGEGTDIGEAAFMACHDVLNRSGN